MDENLVPIFQDGPLTYTEISVFILYFSLSPRRRDEQNTFVASNKQITVHRGHAFIANLRLESIRTLRNMYRMGCPPLKQLHIRGGQGAQRIRQDPTDITHAQAKEDWKSRYYFLFRSKLPGYDALQLPPALEARDL